MTIYGIKEAAKKTESINQKDRSTWVQLYYSIPDRRVYTKDAPGRYLVCNLINKCTPEDIQEFVRDWLNS